MLLQTDYKKKLEEIKTLLSPPIQKTKDKDGNVIYIESSIFYACLAILEDVQRGFVDQVTRKTLNDVIERLSLVEKILDVDKDPIIMDENGHLIIKSELER